MITQPLVSIITPTYNRAAFLGTAIESVLAQTYPHFEHIVVDDGSTDDTPALMERYLRDGRVRYLSQSNQGQSVARNLAIEHCSGEFICFLDSDDSWFPDKLREQVALFHAHPEAGVVYSDYVFVDEKGNELAMQNMARYSGKVTAELLADNFISMNTTMTRAAVIREVGGFAPDDRLSEDYGLWLRVSTRATFLYAPRLWARYRVMADQLSSQTLPRLYSNERLLEAFLESEPHGLSAREIRIGRLQFLIRKARTLSAEGESAAALRAIAQALGRAPLSPQPWRAIVRVILDAQGRKRTRKDRESMQRQ